MWECNFAEEKMDYRLFWLRFVKKIWLIFIAVVAGALLVGVPYYLINVTFGEGPSYKIVSEYYLDYAQDGSGKTYDYINFYTWGEIADTDEFIGILQEEVPQQMFASDETLRLYTDATVESDTRYLYTTVVTEHPDKTIEIARAMERAIVKYSKQQKEFNLAKVITQPMNAEKTYPDVRPLRAFILGAVLGLFAGLVGVTIAIICDNSIFLPGTIEKRYQVKALGCLSFTESKNNICYATEKAKNLAIVGLGDLELPTAMEAIEFVKSNLEKDCTVSVTKEGLLSETFPFETLRTSDKVVFLIRAGAKNGKTVERAIEQMRRQDVKITGVFLFGEDKNLIKQYYR